MLTWREGTSGDTISCLHCHPSPNTDSDLVLCVPEPNPDFKGAIIGYRCIGTPRDCKAVHFLGITRKLYQKCNFTYKFLYKKTIHAYYKASINYQITCIKPTKCKFGIFNKINFCPTSPAKLKTYDHVLPFSFRSVCCTRRARNSKCMTTYCLSVAWSNM